MRVIEVFRGNLGIRSRIVLSALVAGLWLVPGVALAQQKPPAKGAAKAPGPKAAADAAAAAEKEKGGGGRVERTKGGTKIYRLEEIKVEGRIQKPNAFYVLQRSSLNYELESLKQQFIPNILKSVNGGPF